MDDFHYFVVHRGRAADLSAVVGNGSVDCVHLGQLAFFEVLEHAGLQLGVLADGDRNDEERESTLQGIGVVLDDEPVKIQPIHAACQRQVRMPSFAGPPG